jgi:hypothetical protein
MSVDAFFPLSSLSGSVTFEGSYPGRDDQVRQVRHDLEAVVAGCPFADDFVLLASELSTNAIVHSRSGLPGGVFTVRAEVMAGKYAWLEVEDEGGPWMDKGPDEEHGRGLALVSCLAGDGNWTVDAGRAPGSRVVWVWLDWAAERKDQDMVPALCSCGFEELPDEGLTDHLHNVFDPDDPMGNDGLVHEERERMVCACGLSAVTPEQLDAHLLDVFTPGDAVGRDGRRHVAMGDAGDLASATTDRDDKSLC